MYIQPNKNNWTGRVDSIDDKESFRFHQVVKLEDLKVLNNNENAFNIIGFESDEGVRRNKGRVGASQAPDKIKQSLAKLPYNIEHAKISDTGNIRCEGTELEAAQNELGEAVTQLFQSSTVPVIIGGGHETLYGHYLGVRNYIGEDASLGIINIDAHFDMRDEALPSSGTMFKQIMDQDRNADYLCLGIQEFGNTKSLFNTAQIYGCSYVTEEDISMNQYQHTFETIDKFAESHDYILLTLCTDSIASSSAPGVSAASPFGLEPKQVRKLLKYIVAKDNITSFDISEVNPEVDENGKTVKLAALFIAEILKEFNGIKLNTQGVKS